MTIPQPVGINDAQVNDMARMWGGGWRRYFFPGFWLIYLGQTVSGVQKHSHGAAAVVGYVLVAAFAVCYLTALPMGWSGRHRPFWILYVATLVLTAAEMPFAHGDALVFLVYVSVLTVAAKQRWVFAAVIAYTLIAGLLPWAAGWRDGVDWSTALSVFLVSMAMFGFFKIVQANIALSAARAEVARLAAENERSRIARDLHDLLGHSLTTITVKAGLARKLAERGEPERAYAEIREVEQLSRRTLGDVRAAVSAHREVTLVGEIATAHEVLRAADISAEMPASVAETEPLLSELFGWVVREGVTNVVRHSRANHVTVRLGRNWIELEDDGRGMNTGSNDGNGLRGLRERTEALGGTITTSSSSMGGGFRLRVEVPVPVQAGAPAVAVETT